MEDRNLVRGQENFTARMDRLYPNLSNSSQLALAKGLHDVLLPFACVSPQEGYVPFKRLADAVATKIYSMSRSETNDALNNMAKTADEIKSMKDVPSMDQFFVPVENNTSGANMSELSAQVDRELIELSGIHKMIKGQQYAEEYEKTVDSFESHEAGDAAKAFLRKLQDDDLLIEQIDLLPSFHRENLDKEGKRARGFLPATFDSENDNEDDYEDYDAGFDIPNAVITLDADGQIHLSCPECAHDDIYPIGDGVYCCFSCPHDGECRGFMNRDAVAVADLFDRPIEVLTDDYKERLAKQKWEGGFKRI